MANQETSVANSYESTLSASLSAGATTINVGNTDGTPGVPFYVVIDPDDDAKREIVLVDGGKTGTTLTLSSSSQRGQDGTSDVDHDSSAVIGIYPIAAHWTDVNDRIDQHSHGGGSDGAQVDHGGLAGLDDDDHPQYLNTARHDAHDHDDAIAASSVGAASASLTDDTASALDTFEQWGTQEATFSNPGRQVTVVAFLTGRAGWNAGAESRRIAFSRVQISFDGGSTWNEGKNSQSELHGSSQRQTSLAAQHLRTGTPTGQVQVRAQLHQSALGSPGDLTFNEGSIVALMLPS